MKVYRGAWILAILIPFILGRAEAASRGVRRDGPSAGACRKQLERFTTLLMELRFTDAQRLADSLMRATEVDTSWHLDYIAHCAVYLQRYVERRDGASFDSLESYYENSLRHPCKWTYGWLGLMLAYEYSRNANPAAAMMYGSVAAQTLFEQGDSLRAQRAQRLVELSRWQLGDLKTQGRSVSPRNADAQRRGGSLLDGGAGWRPVMEHLERREWRAAEMFLDTLREGFYKEKAYINAGFMAQMMAALCLRQHEPHRALTLLRWADDLPSQRTPASVVFASWYFYGRCYEAMGDYASAIENYKKAQADADGVHEQLYKAKVFTHWADVYAALGAQQSAYTLKRAAVVLQDSVSKILSVKLFQSADNLRSLQDRTLRYQQQLQQEKRNNALRNRRDNAILVLLALAIIVVVVLLYRLWGGLVEKRKQRQELQLLADSLRQRGLALREQGERLEQLHAEGVRQTNRLSRIHVSMRSRAAKIMQSLDYASLIQHGLLPTEQELNAHFADNFLITRALQAVSGDLFWLGSREGVTVAAMVDCTSYGVSGASLSFIAYMLLNSVVKERGVVAPAEVLKEVELELRELMQGADRRFRGEEDIELSVLTIDPAGRIARFSGEGRQLFYSLDGRTVQCLTEQAFSIRDSELRGMPTPTVTIRYRAGAQFYLMTDGFVQQLNADGERLGMQRIASTLEKVLTLPMREQRQELLGLFARHRLAQEQTDDITICGMRLG